jgi:hypothetical protein
MKTCEWSSLFETGLAQYTVYHFECEASMMQTT